MLHDPVDMISSALGAVVLIAAPLLSMAPPRAQRAIVPAATTAAYVMTARIDPIALWSGTVTVMQTNGGFPTVDPVAQ